MSWKPHPSLALIGKEVQRSALLVPRATAMADYLSSDDHGEARLLGFRRCVDNGLEVVLMEIRAELPQDCAADIERWEPVAVAFMPDDRHQPSVLAVRENFPETPHQNFLHAGFMRSPCVDDRPWPEAKATWTPLAFIERIRWWLGAAAQGALSDAAQALDPIFGSGGPDVAIPRAYLQADAGLGLMTLYRCAGTGPAQLYHLRQDGAANGSDPGAMVVIPLRLPPQTMRSVRAAPHSLEALIVALSEFGCDLLSKLRDAARTVLEPPYTDPSRVAVLMVAPLAREAGRPTAVEDTKAFGIPLSLGQLGEHLGVLLRNPDFDAKSTNGAAPFGRILVPAPPVGLDKIPIDTLPVHLEFDRELASQCAGHGALDARMVALVGAGAVGSHVAMALAREGLFRWTVIDDDNLLPHNLARHTLNRADLGAAKAEALAWNLAMVLGNPDDACSLVGNVLYADQQAASLEAALAGAEVIIDASASIAAARKLSGEPASARRVSVFLNPAGTASVLLAEDDGRMIRLDALEAQYYRVLLRDPALREHLSASGDGLRYTGACRQVSSRIPASNVAVLSGLLSRGVSAALAGDHAKIAIWTMDGDGAVSVKKVAPHQVKHLAMAAWTILYDEGLVEDMATARRCALPAETGGILVGIVDTDRKVIVLVDALAPPPDSVGSRTEFIRGVEGLSDRLQVVHAITRDQVRYVGEWHSHPRGHGADPSGTDLQQLAFLHTQLSREGIPPVMMIMGQQGEAVVTAKRLDNIDGTTAMTRQMPTITHRREGA